MTTGFVLVSVGWLHRAPWLIVLMTPALTVLYALGKWDVWAATWRRCGIKPIVFTTVCTWPSQLVVAGVFYLAGLGQGRLLTGYVPITGLSTADATAAGALFVAGVIVSSAIIRLEGIPARSPDTTVHTVTTATNQPGIQRCWW